MDQWYLFLSVIDLKKVVNNDNKIEEIIEVVELEKKVEPKKVHPIEKKNRSIFGDEYVDNLKSKYVEFKLNKKKF